MLWSYINVDLIFEGSVWPEYRGHETLGLRVLAYWVEQKVCVPHNILKKNPNNPFGQPNTLLVNGEPLIFS